MLSRLLLKSLLFYKDWIIYVHMYVHEYMNVQETSVRLPGPEVTDHYELLHEGAGNHALVLRDSKCS